MKKILALTLMLAFAGSSFATDLPTNTVSTAGAAIYGGSIASIAQNATNPVVKCSTGVSAVVNFDTTNPVSYAIMTKHAKGSKVFGTANDSTAIYWKASPAATLTTTETGAASDNTTAFVTPGTWTTY